MSDSFLYFIIPIAVVVLGLKCCLLWWRIHYYQQRRQAQFARQAQIRQLATTRAQNARAAAQARAAGGTTEPRLTSIVTRAPDGSHQVYIIPSTNGQLQGTSLVFPSDRTRQSLPTGQSHLLAFL